MPGPQPSSPMRDPREFGAEFVRKPRWQFSGAIRTEPPEDRQKRAQQRSVYIDSFEQTTPTQHLLTLVGLVAAGLALRLIGQQAGSGRRR